MHPHLLIKLISCTDTPFENPNFDTALSDSSKATLNKNNSRLMILGVQRFQKAIKDAVVSQQEGWRLASWPFWVEYACSTCACVFSPSSQGFPPQNKTCILG